MHAALPLLSGFGVDDEQEPAPQFELDPINLNLENFQNTVHFLTLEQVPALDGAMQVLETFREHLSRLPNVVHFDVEEDETVVLIGDLHGRFFDLVAILRFYGYLTEDGTVPDPTQLPKLVFNGDFVDRGYYSLAVVFSLLYLRHICPDRVFLNRGNHESQYSTSLYGFEYQLKRDYGMNPTDLYLKFIDVFRALPLLTVVDGTIGVVHGGVSVRVARVDANSAITWTDECHTLEEIDTVDRFKEPDSDHIINNLLWCDPAPVDDPTDKDLRSSIRGLSYQFPAYYTHQFLKANGLKLLVRSHEVVPHPRSQHEGRCITVFTAANYVEDTNKGFVLEFNKEQLRQDLPTYSTRYFERQPEPDGTKQDYNPLRQLQLLFLAQAAINGELKLPGDS